MARIRLGVHHRVGRSSRPAQTCCASSKPPPRPRALEGIGAHTLRHSVAVGWLESGVHIKAVADLLGHSGVSITGDAYGHASDDTARAAVDGLEWGARTVNGLSNSHENAPGSWHIGGWRA